MEKVTVKTYRAPAAVGAYSQATIGGGIVCISGQLPIDPETGKLAETLEEQVHRSMENVIALAEEAGSSRENILKCGLFIRDMSQFSKINAVYETFFGENAPARFVVEVSALPKGAQIEIDAIALL